MKLNIQPKWFKVDNDPLRFKPKPAHFWLIFCWLMIGLIGLLIIAHTILFILWSEPIAEAEITQDVTDRHQVNTNLLTKIAARESGRFGATSTPVLSDPGLPNALRAKLGE